MRAGYMQMTQAQEEDWAEDPNVYVADEDDDVFSVRTSGELVLEELLRAADGAAGVLAAAVRRRMDEAAAAQVRDALPSPRLPAMQPLNWQAMFCLSDGDCREASGWKNIVSSEWCSLL